MPEEIRNFEMEAVLAALKAAALSFYMFYESRAQLEIDPMSEADRLLKTKNLAHQAVKMAIRGLPDDHPLRDSVDAMESDLMKLIRFSRSLLKID